MGSASQSTHLDAASTTRRAAPEGPRASGELNGAPSHNSPGPATGLVRRLALLAAIWLAAESAQAGLFGPDTDSRGLSGVQKIAVFSRLGDSFHGRWVGVTAFNNKFFDAPVPDWAIEPFIQQSVKETLSADAMPRSAEALDTSGLDLKVLYTKSGAVTFSNEVVGTLLDQARKQGADALLVIEMAGWGGPYQFESAGFGVFRNPFGGCIYTAFMATVFRTDSGKRAGSTAEPPPCVSSKTDSFEVKATWDEYSPEQKTAFETAVKQKIRERLTIQFRHLGLISSSDR